MPALPKDLSPEMLVRNPSLLLHSKPSVDDFTADDGLVGAVISKGQEIITSPNSKFIFSPPLGGDRSVFLRSDLLFADDDPLQWPQPYVEEACHLACIPRQPMEENSSSIMWWMPTHRDFELEDHGVVHGIGKLVWSKMRELKVISDPLIIRARQARFKEVRLAPQLAQTLEDILHRLERISTSFRKMQLGVRALQRVYLELVAVADYHEIYAPLMEGSVRDAPSALEHRIGVVTSDLNICLRMYRANIPVWFIRPYCALHSIRISSITRAQPALGVIELEPASRPGYPPIYVGSLDDPEAYRAIARHTLAFLQYPNPFASTRAETSISAPLPLPGPSKKEVRSKRYAPYTNRKKEAASSSGGRNKFEDIQSALLPPAIPTWRQALEDVDIEAAQFRYTELIPSDLGYVFPEPASFLSIKLLERQKAFFSTWLRYRSTLIYRVSSGSSNAQPIPNTVWRTLLSGDFVAKGRGLEDGKPTRSRKLKEIAEDFLRDCLDAEGVEFVDPDHADATVTWNSKVFESLGNDDFEEILWELAELNFRFELMALDSRASTAPSDSRQQLISACFPRSNAGASLLVADLSGANQGLASISWEIRGTFVQALRKVMASWHGDLPPIIRVDKFDWPRKELEELENAITQHYCKTFYEYFRRAPIVPRRLSHIVLPYRPPTPKITIQDPRPNIFYDVTALAL